MAEASGVAWVRFRQAEAKARRFVAFHHAQLMLPLACKRA